MDLNYIFPEISKSFFSVDIEIKLETAQLSNMKASGSNDKNLKQQ